MKLTEKMRFPHPVLCEDTPDYLIGEFAAAFSQQLTEDFELKITSKFEVSNSEIQKFIENQSAALGYFIVCQRTFFNSLQEVPLCETDRHFNLSLVWGAIKIRPLVWSKKKISNFPNKSADEEFGHKINFRKATILAYGPEFRFSIDPKRFKPFESIFNLLANDDVPLGMIEVDTDQDKIGINANRKTYDSIVQMRNTPLTSSVMLSSVYMPAIVEIVSRIQNGSANFDGLRWYQVLLAKCEQIDIEIQNPANTPLSVAQQLLNAPIQTTTIALENTSW